MRELIPEFYFLPEIFENINKINFEEKDSKKNIKVVDNVEVNMINELFYNICNKKNKNNCNNINDNNNQINNNNNNDENMNFEYFLLKEKNYNNLLN